jgi:predicted HTH domain antitoxin
MSQVTIDIPEETFVKLFELGRISFGAAARLAGVPRVFFLTRNDTRRTD